MARWALPPVDRLRLRLSWRRSSLHSAVLGIGAVAMATVAVGMVCAAIALVVTWIY